MDGYGLGVWVCEGIGDMDAGRVLVGDGEGEGRDDTVDVGLG